MTPYCIKHTLNFIRPGGTSRGVLSTKDSWFFILRDQDIRIGLGECSIIGGLSPDVPEEIVQFFERQTNDVNWQKPGWSLNIENVPGHLPAVRFALETAFRGIEMDDPFLLYDTPFVKGKYGIPINGLIWMGSREFMFAQIQEKLKQGYSCLKLKIGSIDFNDELDLLAYIRKQFSANDVELRVDANGAFEPAGAMEKLKRLSAFDLHSIEQPVGQGQTQIMAELCASTPLPIALDEELIGVNDLSMKRELLETIQPQFIIIKPSLLGGLARASEWIELAESGGIGWWVTSALESNLGLNAIAQWTASLNTHMPQGLGTGQLFSNNLGSPLEIRESRLYYNPEKAWQLDLLG